MDIGIFLEYEGTVVQFPVNPSKFDVKTSGNNKTAEIITLGEIIIPKKKKLSEISWDCFFPYLDWYPAIRTKGSFESAKFYLDFINKIRDDCKPCHLTVTGIDFDEDVVIQNFDYFHQAGDHEDAYYSIEFSKYQPHSISVISQDLATGQPVRVTAVGTTRPQSSTPVRPTELTIGCEVLVSGTLYGDSYGNGLKEALKAYPGKIGLINNEGSCPYYITTPNGIGIGWIEKGGVKLI